MSAAGSSGRRSRMSGCRGPVGTSLARRRAVRRAGTRGPYRAAVVPAIAGRTPHVGAAVLRAAEDAAAEIARFDTRMGAEIAPFAAVLLRTESASSSRIEQLTSGARAIAVAAAGFTVHPQRRGRRRQRRGHEGRAGAGGGPVPGGRAGDARSAAARHRAGHRRALAQRPGLGGAARPTARTRRSTWPRWPRTCPAWSPTSPVRRPHRPRPGGAGRGRARPVRDHPPVPRRQRPHRPGAGALPAPPPRGHPRGHRAGLGRPAGRRRGLLRRAAPPTAAASSNRSWSVLHPRHPDRDHQRHPAGRASSGGCGPAGATWCGPASDAAAWRIADLLVRQPVVDAAAVARELGMPAQNVVRGPSHRCWRPGWSPSSPTGGATGCGRRTRCSTRSTPSPRGPAAARLPREPDRAHRVPRSAPASPDVAVPS